MYCPNCGSQNQTGIKFCTRCGTNLAVVAEALNGKPTEPPEPNERMVKLLTKYYDGRRSTAVGGVSLVVGLLILLLLGASNMNQDDLITLLLIGLAGCSLIYGAIAVIAGAAEWIQSSSEMKALGYHLPSKPLPLPAPQSTGKIINLQGEYTTDPIRDPGSVTESTTRQLEERAPLPPRDSQTKQAN